MDCRAGAWALLLAMGAGCARDVVRVDHSSATTGTGSGGSVSVGVTTSSQSAVATTSSATGGCLTCADLGYECGLASDGCGHTLDCGTCPKCSVCDDLQNPGKCVAQCCPKTCADFGPNWCGPTSDGCGSIINCATCAPGEQCTNNACVPVCDQPKTCAQQGFNCGIQSDSCGGTINCGTCPAGQLCGGGCVGMPGVCGYPGCCPKTCAAQGYQCGVASDGCNGTLQCGGCPPGQTCGAGGHPNVCGT